MFSGREVSIADLWMDLSDPESTLFGQFWHLRGRGYKSVSFLLAWRDLGKSVGLRRPYEAAFGEETLPTVSTTKAATRSCHHASSPAYLPACLPRITSNSVCCLSPCCPDVLLPCCPAALVICRPALLAPCCPAALSPGLRLLNALPLAT